MSHVPIIPPYEPATGITQTPERNQHRRPAMGKLSQEEALVESTYLPAALAIVKKYWPHFSVTNIRLEIMKELGWQRCPASLVYALKRRLDRGQG